MVLLGRRSHFGVMEVGPVLALVYTSLWIKHAQKCQNSCRIHPSIHRGRLDGVGRGPIWRVTTRDLAG